MPAICCAAVEWLSEIPAMQIMTKGRFRHLPVMDHDTLVGLISIGDVVKARIMHQDTVVESLTAYVAGSA